MTLPGFTDTQQSVLAKVICGCTGRFTAVSDPSVTDELIYHRIIRLLRLAILLTHRRNDQALPVVTLIAKNSLLTLQIDSQWLHNNPLTQIKLRQEALEQTQLECQLDIIID